MESPADTMRAIEWSRSLDQQGYVEIPLGRRWRPQTLRVDAGGLTLPGADETVPWTEIAEVVEDAGRVVVLTADDAVPLPRGGDATLAAWLESRIDEHLELPAAPQLLLAHGDDESQVVCYDRTQRWVDLDRLSLSDGLATDLRDWDRRTRANLASSAPMAERVAAFEAMQPEGRAIAARMEAELPPGSRVRLVDDTLGDRGPAG